VNGPVPLSGIPSDLSLMLHGGMCRLEHLMTVSPQIKHDVMYGVLQATSGNENVGFPFLCQSTYKRRTVFSFPPIVSCRVWVLTMMCLSPACLISEFPPPPLFFFARCVSFPLPEPCYIKPLPSHMTYMQSLKYSIISVSQTPFLRSFCCMLLYDRHIYVTPV